MSDEAEAATAEPKKKSKKKLVIILAGLLLLVGGGGGAYFGGLLGGKNDSAAASADGASAKTDKPAKAEKAAAADSAEAGVFHDLPDVLVNLDGTGRQAHFLKMKISLELANKTDEAAIDKVMPRVMDQFQTYLRELRIDDLKGAAGIYRLRQELLIRVSAAAAPIEVRDVLFREMLIQ